MLEWFAQSPDPDAGLLAFRKISEGLGDTHWYLRKLRDEGEGAEQLSQIVGSSRYVTDLILRAPDSVALLGDDAELVPRDADRLDSEMELAARRHRKPEDAIRAVRRVRRRELSRVGIADVARPARHRRGRRGPVRHHLGHVVERAGRVHRGGRGASAASCRPGWRSC